MVLCLRELKERAQMVGEAALEVVIRGREVSEIRVSVVSVVAL